MRVTSYVQDLCVVLAFLKQLSQDKEESFIAEEIEPEQNNHAHLDTTKLEHSIGDLGIATKSLITDVDSIGNETVSTENSELQ